MKGEVLRTVRKEQNMSQEELALELEVTISTISNWERKDVPDGRYIKSIAEALDVSVHKLTGVPSNDLSVEVKSKDTYEEENILLQSLMESFDQIVQDKEKNIEND
ncbi:helix-turn-helix domain-containing protein [Psychrobacillus antarcticus]|uniref:helix-turn-helix domain-containing protein n=1 Tax=Psychrobacillus antarcticus TaxID=2879115 RepID=UPI00240821DC|nr:helix-turn-helix transcriptional regulator [Psychrobacillus antarcticus]